MKQLLPKKLKSIILTFVSLIVLTNLVNAQNFTASSFNTKVDFPSGISGPNSIAIGDLDGYGKLDMAVGTNSATISLFRNTSASGSITAGSFAPRIELVVGATYQSIAIGDLDGDGKPELVVASFSTNTVSIFRNISS